MSPELFDPERFDLKDSRQTKHSDCYALGMVLYEVLSGRAPFSRHHGPAIIGAIIKGERPRRPRGEGGAWLTDGVWSMMERCWRPRPDDRPSIGDVLECLDGVSRSWTPPSPQTVANTSTTDSPTRSSDSWVKESTSESEVSSPSPTVPLCPLQDLPLEGDPNEIGIYPSAHEFPTLLHGASDYLNLGMSAIHPNGSDSEGSAGILDRVSPAGLLHNSRY